MRAARDQVPALVTAASQLAKYGAPDAIEAMLVRGAFALAVEAVEALRFLSDSDPWLIVAAACSGCVR